MSGRLIAIGDIHGCSQALESILAAIDPTKADTIVTLGDYVDRGPDAKGSIDRLIEVGKTCKLIAIQGNHEEMMLDVVRDGQPPFRWLQYGGVETLDSYGFAGDMSVIPPEHFAFFDAMVDYHETEHHIFVHANYDPDRAMEEQGKYLWRWRKLSEATPGPHRSGKRVLVGHTHDPGGEIFDIGHLVCIDTHVYGRGWLTALDVHSGQIWQANQQGTMRTG